jgi:hypothetical protein
VFYGGKRNIFCSKDFHAVPTHLAVTVEVGEKVKLLYIMILTRDIAIAQMKYGYLYICVNKLCALHYLLSICGTENSFVRFLRDVLDEFISSFS